MTDSATPITLTATDPLAVGVTDAIESGALGELSRLLDEHPGLANARIAARRKTWRTPLHVVTHWPGYFPNGPAVVDPPSQEGLDEAFWQACHGGQLRTAQLLAARGAQVDATPTYSDGRTPLDIAASLDERRSQLVRWLGEHGAKTAAKPASPS